MQIRKGHVVLSRQCRPQHLGDIFSPLAGQVVHGHGGYVISGRHTRWRDSDWAEQSMAELASVKAVEGGVSLLTRLQYPPSGGR